MFERLNTPEELYNLKLGAALKMEHTVVEMLDDNAQAAQGSELERLFRHQDETREQIANLEKTFAALGWEVDDSPCPAIEGIEKEGKANVKKVELLKQNLEQEHTLEEVKQATAKAAASSGAPSA